MDLMLNKSKIPDRLPHLTDYPAVHVINQTPQKHKRSILRRIADPPPQIRDTFHDKASAETRSRVRAGRFYIRR